MSILYRNGARLFEPGRGGGGAPEVTPNTQFLCHFQPRMPWSPGTANGDALVDESGNLFDLSLAAGTNNTFGSGPVPESHALYFDGATGLHRTANDLELEIVGDVTMEVYIRVTEDPAGTTKVMIFGDNSELQADNILYSMDITPGPHPRYIHEYGAGLNEVFEWTGTVLPLHEWVYLAMVRDDVAKTVTLYINGVADPAVFTYVNSPDGGTASELHVGFGVAGTQFFTGWMSGARVMDVARTAEDIAATWKRINPNDPDNVRPADLLPEVGPSTHASATLYVEAGQHDVDDGDTVTTPTLLAGPQGVTQATVADRPYIITAGGAPGWRMFDDVSQGKFFNGPNVNTLIQLSPVRYHAFCAFTLYGADKNSGSLWTNHRLFGDNSGFWGMYARRDAGANQHFGVYGYHFDGAQKAPAIEPVLRHQIHLAEFWYDVGTGESVLRIDDGDPFGAGARVAAGNITGSGLIEVGGNSTDEFHGVIHSLMIANDFDAARQQGIRNYFANKYRVRV